MLFFDVFANYAHLLILLAAFVVLFASIWKVRTLNNGKCLLFLAFALAGVLVASALQHFSVFFYNHAVSIKILTLTEMLLVIAVSLLLLMAASMGLFGKILGIPFIFVFVSFSLLLSLYAIYVVDDANIISSIGSLLPIVCMSCTFLSFIAQSGLLHRPSVMLSGTVCAVLLMMMIKNLLGTMAYAWYLPVFLILLLAFAAYMAFAENLGDKLAKVMEKQAKMAENIENIVRSSPFPIIISKLGEGRIVIANRNATKLFGINDVELSRYYFKDFFVDDNNRRLFMEKLEKKQEVQDFEILVKSATGNTPFWLLASANVVDYDNGVVLYTAFQDITNRKRREDILRTQADRDPLTAIFNRRYFEAHATERIMKARHSKQPFAVLMLDADNFKRINDTYGHKIGDKVLIELAAVCERTLRSEDMVARYGGEEFVVFLENVTPDIAEIVANRLREAISSIVVYSDEHEPISFTVSIGIAPSGISNTVDRMIKMADDAMYIAKQKGRNRVEMYDVAYIDKLQKDKQRENNQKHPAFVGENEEEISLLDGIETSHIN